jgi:hypothetical protein
VAPRLAVVPELEAELDRLYGRSLSEFTSARNELVTRLSKAGQAEAAETVRGLRKPSVPVWAVNQLARRHPNEVEALVDAGERLRRAQEDAFRGRGAAGVREATTLERTALRALTRLAERVLTADGRPATQQTLERVASTLRSAAIDPEAAPLLAAGRLADEVESSGFAALATIAPPPSRKKSRTDATSELTKRREQLLRRLRRRVDQLERRAADLETKARRTEETAAAARAAANDARAEVESARQELEAADSGPRG